MAGFAVAIFRVLQISPRLPSLLQPPSAVPARPGLLGRPTSLGSCFPISPTTDGVLSTVSSLIELGIPVMLRLGHQVLVPYHGFVTPGSITGSGSALITSNCGKSLLCLPTPLSSAVAEIIAEARVVVAEVELSGDVPVVLGKWQSVPGHQASLSYTITSSAWPASATVVKNRLFPSCGTGLSHICKRSITTGGGSVKKTAEELLIWQMVLEKQQQSLNAEKMTVDAVIQSVTASWLNYGKVHGRASSPGLVGGLMKFVYKNMNSYMMTCLVWGGWIVLGSVLIWDPLKPGEAKTLPESIMKRSTAEFRNMQSRSRIIVCLDPDDGQIRAPQPQFPPTSVVVIIGGTYPILRGNLFYGNNLKWASLMDGKGGDSWLTSVPHPRPSEGGDGGFG